MEDITAVQYYDVAINGQIWAARLTEEEINAILAENLLGVSVRQSN